MSWCVTDVYAAGETPRPGVTGKLIVDASLDAHPGRGWPGSPARTTCSASCAASCARGDLCLTMGAGDVTSLADDVLGRPAGAT